MSEGLNLLLVVVLVRQVEPGGGCLQPAGFRGEILGVGVGAAYDQRELREGRIGESIRPDDRVEAALLVVVPELHVRHVEGRGSLLVGHRQHPVGRHVQELGLRIDESLDQPRTGNAVHFRPLAGDPLHRQTSSRSSR